MEKQKAILYQTYKSGKSKTSRRQNKRESKSCQRQDSLGKNFCQRLKHNKNASNVISVMKKRHKSSPLS